MYMAKLQQVSPNVEDSGPIFDKEAEQKSQELKNVSYYKLYDILKQHQHEVNEIRTEKIARVANLLALVAQQQPVYHPQTHPTHYNQNSSTRSQQAATRNRGKAIVNSPRPTYDQEPSMVEDDDDETSKDNEIDKLMALISLSFKKIYKPTNNNLRTSSNTSCANQDNSPRIHRNDGYEHQRLGNVAGARETVGSTVVQKSGIQCYNCKEYGYVARECQKPKKAKDATYHREKMLLCKQEEAGIQLNAEQVSPDINDSGPIFDKEPEQKENDLLYADFKKSKAELQRRDSIEYASEMELECAKVREMKNKLSAHQDTISILKQQKDAQIKLYKSREDKELEKVIDLENKVKVLDNIVYKTGQTVQTMTMLNNKCQTSCVKPEYLKKAKQANPRLYDIGCYNDNLALMLSPESDEVIRLEKESRSNLKHTLDKLEFSEYFPNLGNEFCDELNKEFIKLFEFHSGNSGSDCSDLDIDEDVDECKEEKILKEESRLRLEEDARFMREEDKLLEDENFFEKDYKKREFALMNSDHMKQVMKRVVPKKRSHCTVVTSSSWLKVSNKFKDKLQGRCAINQDMTEFCKNMKPWF
nr:hypothetical protein [Tanacetum cinerariifolium]